MTLELIVFIAAILFGVLLYWRESNGNGLYRILNKIVNSKELQMKPDDRTGFVFQQKFLLRLVYITFLFLVVSLILKFLIPISYATVSIFASCVVGTLLGTYLANFVLKSGKIVDEKSESLGELVGGAIDKGKEILDDMTSNDDIVEEAIEDKPEDTPNTETPSAPKKSARERLKDKGYLK
jgi:putative Mn2+ efflux pump MntP